MAVCHFTSLYFTCSRPLGTLANVSAIRCRTVDRRCRGPEVGEVEVAALGETHLSHDWLSVHGLLNRSGEVARSRGIRTGLVKAGKILREPGWTGNLLAVLAVDDAVG